MKAPDTVARPTGTVTFLFTDIVGSTRLWERHPVEMEAALSWHDGLMAASASKWNGYAFNHSGDSWVMAFADPLAAARCALEIRDRLDEIPNDTVSLSVRLVIDTAAVRDRDGDYFGSPLSRAARTLEHTRGGEILMSASAAGLIRHGLEPSLNIIDLGEFKLRGLRGWEHLFRLERGHRRHAGWRLRLQHGAWLALLAAVVTIGWMAVAWPPPFDPGRDSPTAVPETSEADMPNAGRTAEVSWISGAGMGRPLVKDGRILVGGPNGALVALELGTGTEIWSFDLPATVVGAPVAESGHVFVVDDRTTKITGVTEADGSLVFSCATGSSVVSPPGAGSGRVFVLTTDTPQVWAFDARPTSPERCQVDGVDTAIKAFGGIQVPPVAHGHTLLAVDRSGIVHAFDGRDLARGAVWTYDVPNASGTDFDTYTEARVTQPSVLEVALASRAGIGVNRPLVVMGEQRVRNSAEGWRLIGVDLHTGEARLDPITVGGPPAVGLGRIWVANIDRTELMVLDHAGTLEHTLRLAMSDLAPLVDAEADRIYVVSPEQTITAVNGVDLTVEWEYEFGGRVERLAAGRGVLLIHDQWGRITAIQESDS